MDAFVKAYQDLNGWVKTVIYVGGLIAALTGAYTTGKAIAQVPGKLDQHMADQQATTKVLDKMLCIQVADHRKMDWTTCYIDPTKVIPSGNH